MTEFQKADKLSANNTTVKNNIGAVYLAKGDRARAIAHINQAIEIDPQDREAVALFRQIGSGR